MGDPNEFLKPNLFGDDLKDESSLTARPIIISTVAGKGRKKDTIVSGIPNDIDLELVAGAWRRLFHCTASKKRDNKLKEDYIELKGDHRDEVMEFLIHEGIGTEENIKKQGA